MTAEKLMVELIIHLEKLSDVEIITEYGIDSYNSWKTLKSTLKKYSRHGYISQ